LQSWGFVDHLTWNEPAWSISVEMFAYLIFPLILAYLTQARLFLFVLFAAGLWLWIHTCSYLPAITFLAAHGLILPTPAAPAMHFAEGIVLLRYVPIFVAGVVLFCSIRNRDLPRWVGDLFLISGIALIIYISLTHDGWIEPITGAAILIVTGLFRSGAIGYFLFANSVSVTLGEVSYALYLSHDGLKYILAKTFGFRLQLLPLLLATLLVATILHFGVERPARALLRRRLKSFPPKVTSLESVVSGE
jgi:peptidoglycan/LPS O-acetylase OafA/YrhL